MIRNTYKDKGVRNGMNKKGGLIGAAILIVFAVVLAWFIIIPAVGTLIEDYKDYKEYEEFCEERIDFCYCERFECNFLLSWKNEVPTGETREYCELAEEL